MNNVLVESTFVGLEEELMMVKIEQKDRFVSHLYDLLDVLSNFFIFA